LNTPVESLTPRRKCGNVNLPLGKRGKGNEPGRNRGAVTFDFTNREKMRTVRRRRPGRKGGVGKGREEKKRVGGNYDQPYKSLCRVS